MKRLIHFLFGQPHTGIKFLMIGYWCGVLFYFLTMSLLMVHAIIHGGWTAFLISAIIFPILFRIVYKLNIATYEGFKGLNKRFRIILGLVFLLTTAGLITIPFLFGDNLALNVTTYENDGNFELTIGSLKGYYEVQTLEVDDPEQGVLEIPYEITSGEGSLLLSLETEEEVLWQKEVSSSDKGNIKIDSQEGYYYIMVYTEEAKDISVKLSLY